MSGISNIPAQFQATQSLGPSAGTASAASLSAGSLSAGSMLPHGVLPGGVAPGGVLAAEAPAYSTPFAGVMRDAIAKTQALDTQATHAVSGLLSGQGVDVHAALIATEKSDLAFEMMLSLRNKAVGAYQQLMGMQF